MKMTIARLLDVSADRVQIDFAGLNHLLYGLNVYVDGKSVMEQAIEVMGDPQKQISMQNIAPLPWEAEFIKSMKLIPCPYHRYYYKTKEILEEELEAFSKKTTRAETVKKLEAELFELYTNPDLAVKPPQLEKRGGAYYSDAACNLISSLYNDSGDIQTLNVRNSGAISGIPDDSAVEINCYVTAEGPKPIPVGELPVSVNGLVQQIKSFERIAAQAAVTGSYHDALLALTINPLVTSDKVAKLILDEMLEAHKEYLPQFLN